MKATLLSEQRTVHVWKWRCYRHHHPGHRLKDLDLDVTKTKLVAESRTMSVFWGVVQTPFVKQQLTLTTHPSRRLALPLPYPVKEADGNAKWDATKVRRQWVPQPCSLRHACVRRKRCRWHCPSFGRTCSVSVVDGWRCCPSFCPVVVA